VWSFFVIRDLKVVIREACFVAREELLKAEIFRTWGTAVLCPYMTALTPTLTAAVYAG
jgi:hypothetical protein